MLRVLLTAFVLTGMQGLALAQHELSLGRIIDTYSLESPDARIARIEYRNDVIDYENFKKDYLPAIAFQLNPIAFNNSIRTLQNPTDGSYTYVNDFSNNSNAGINLSQKVGITGGTFTLGSSLNMLSEFSDRRYSFSTSPFRIGYTQQLSGGGKNYKWQKEIARKKYDRAQKNYCRELATIQQTAVALFMDVFILKLSKEIAWRYRNISDTLVRIGETRYRNRVMIEEDYLQLELQYANDCYTYENTEKQYQTALNALQSYLGLPETETVRLEPPARNALPPFLSYRQVLSLAENHHPFFADQEITRIENEKMLYETRLAEGINSNISLNYGMNQYAQTFAKAYKRPQSQQSVNISLQIPIFQWGMGKNRIKQAENNAEISRINQEKERDDFYNRLKEEVNDYNHNVKLLEITEKAREIAERSYELTVHKFDLNEATVYELTNAQKEALTALQNYYRSMKEVWNGYYSLRLATLFDFSEKRELIDLFLSNEQPF